jgi:hypothetical protein
MTPPNPTLKDVSCNRSYLLRYWANSCLRPQQSPQSSGPPAERSHHHNVSPKFHSKLRPDQRSPIYSTRPSIHSCACIHFLSHWRLARLADTETEEYMRLHPAKPVLGDNVAMRGAYKMSRPAGRLNQYQIAALKRRFVRLIRARRCRARHSAKL